MKRYQIIIGLLFISLFTSKLQAQINPLGAQYFHNPYLANPALAGYQGGLTLNTGVRSQWSSIPGAPRTQSLTLDYGREKFGVGLNMNNERKADFTQTKVQGTLAFHMPLSGFGNRLHFGLSAGLQRNRFGTENVVGNQNDLSLQNYNNRNAVFDVDFGMAYTSERFELEGAAYNLNSQTKNEFGNTANFNQFYFAAGYLVNFSDWKLKPRVAYRVIKDYDNIADIGMEVKTINDKIGLSAMYHTNESTSFGLSYLHLGKWQFIGIYNTPTSPISNYATGNFEVGIKIKLNKTQPK